MPRATKIFTTPPLKILKCTQLAVQCETEDGEKHWFPFSQIREPDQATLVDGIGSEQTFEVSIPEWMAKEKGFM